MLGRLYKKLAAELAAVRESHRMDIARWQEQLEPCFQEAGLREASTQGAMLSILVVRLDRIGDFILMSPFLRELRRSFPAARISLLVRPVVAELARRCPYVNEVLELELADRQLTLTGMQRLLEFAHEHLWERSFALAFCPRASDSVMVDGMAAYMSGAQQRIGCSANVFGVQADSYEKRALLFDRLFTKAVRQPQRPMQELERNLLLLEAAGLQVQDRRLEVWFTAADRWQAAQLLAAVPRNRRLAAVSIGASEPRKTYPVELLAKSLAVLAAQEELCFLLLGGPEERAAGEQLAQALPAGKAVNLAGQAALPVSEALVARSVLYIGNDTGLLHMAAALQRPIVEISCDLVVPQGLDYLRLPVHFEPWQVPYILLRPAKGLAPCDGLHSPLGCIAQESHCIREIAPETVAAAALQLLRIGYRG